MLPNLLVQFGPFPVYTFGVILAVTFFLGIFLFWRAATRAGFASEPIFDLIFLSTFFALLAGRISFVVVSGELSDPLAILRMGEGVFWAPAFAVGLTVFYLYVKRRREWSFLKLADIAAPLVSLGQGIGFLGAEATLYLPSAAAVGAGYLGLFVLLMLGRRKITTIGIIFSLYLFGAGFLTILSEYLRPVKAVAFGVDLNYYLGGALLVGGFSTLVYLFARSRGLLALIQRKGTPFPVVGEVAKRLRFRLKIVHRFFRREKRDAT